MHDTVTYCVNARGEVQNLAQVDDNTIEAIVSAIIRNEGWRERMAALKERLKFERRIRRQKKGAE
jgi:hypothetical protein